MKTKVGFIFYTSQEGWIGGRNYFVSLFDAIHRFAREDMDVVVFVGTKANLQEFGVPEDFQIVQHKIFDRKSILWYIDKVAKRILGLSFLTNYILRKFKVDVVSHVDPKGIKGVKKIAWIPDFQHVHLAHYFEKKELLSRNKEFKEFIDHADMVLVSSEMAKNDLKNFDPENFHKARVLRFAAITPDTDCMKAVESCKSKYEINKPFFYVPNQFWIHKNHDVLIEAIHLLKSKFPEILVVCSGALVDYRKSNHVVNLKNKINSYNLNESIRLLGLIPYADISPLMLASIAVINPSFFEGWSTTVEESKALGVPLIVSDIPVHKEQCVSLSYPLFFDPLSPQELSDCMRQLILQDAKFGAIDIESVLELHMQQVKTFSNNFVKFVQNVLE